jgi:hypothetical protein
MKIILGTPDGTPMLCGSSGSSFGLFRDVLTSALDGCTVCAECTTGMEIILGTPDGTPRCHVSSRSSFIHLKIVLV